jgi:VWFA-related protein
MTSPRKTVLIGLALTLSLLAAKPASVAPQQPQQPEPPPTLRKPGQPVQPGQPSPQSQPSQPSQAPPSGQPPPTIRVPVNLVVVPVTVKDSSNQLVGDLRRDEFRILEDGVEQRITLFSVETAPLSVVIVVDNDLKPKTADSVHKTLEEMAAGFSAADEVALGRFDAFYTPVLDFTSDNDQLLTELKHLQLGDAFATGSQPVTTGPSQNGQPVAGAPTAAQIPNRLGKSTKHINDALHDAAELLRMRDSQRRRMIILVSDGTNVKNNTYSYEETLRLLLSSNISVYSIGVDQAVILRGTTILSRYAHATGGDVYYAAKSSELADLYTRVTEQARHQYTLGYLPAETDRGKPYHSIEVRIRRPGLSLLTRDGYYSVATP